MEKLAGSAGRPAAAERKRLRIVAAATELFARQGFRKTSIEEVAVAAGVAKGTVYLYARNKSDLLLQALVEEKRRSMDLFADVLAQGVEPRERLRRWVRASIALAPSLPLSSALISGDREILTALDALDADQRADTQKLQAQFLEELLTEAMAPLALSAQTLQERALTLNALMMSVLMADARVRGGLPLERYADRLAELVVNGVFTSERSR